MLSSIPGIENLSPAVKYVIAFAIIFVLLALFALVLRRLTGGRLTLASDRGRARQPRLGIVDVYDLDRQRQLILLRRDNVEHLLLVGGPNDVVVETNIVRVPGARLPNAGPDADRADAVPERSPEVAPARPVLEAPAARPNGRPAEPVVAGHLGRVETAPANVSPARGSSSSRPDQARASTGSPGLRLAEAPRQGASSAIGSGRPTAARLPSAPPRPAGSAAPPREGETPGPAQSSASRQVNETTKRPGEANGSPARQPEPARQNSSPRPTRVETQPAPSANEAGPRPRPDAPPRPGPSLVPVDRPAPGEVQAGPANRGSAPVPTPSSPAVGEPPPTPSGPTPEGANPSLSSGQPGGQAQPPASTPRPPVPEAPEPTAAPTARPDPFSIEDIEAEFARLLGRPLDRKDTKG